MTRNLLQVAVGTLVGLVSGIALGFLLVPDPTGVLTLAFALGVAAIVGGGSYWYEPNSSRSAQ